GRRIERDGDRRCAGGRGQHREVLKAIAAAVDIARVVGGDAQAAIRRGEVDAELRVAVDGIGGDAIVGTAEDGDAIAATVRDEIARWRIVAAKQVAGDVVRTSRGCGGWLCPEAHTVAPVGKGRRTIRLHAD